jgi:hypothetical protein
MNWIDLPGPSSFLSRIERDLRDSKSVLTLVPSCFDDRWVTAIRSRLEGSYHWHESPGTPDQFLTEVSTRNDGLAFIKPQELIAAGIRGRGYVLRTPPAESWASWQTFLHDFAEANRSVDEMERNVFLISTFERGNQLPNQPLLSHLRMEDFFRDEDSLFYSSLAIEPEDVGGLWRRIRMNVSAEIAGWDFPLCEQLCELPVAQLLNPYEWLLAEALCRGWDGLNSESPEHLLRQMGLLLKIERNERKHSLLLALDKNRKEIQKRVWIAQVRVLFPLIEEQRLLLLKVLRVANATVIKAWENEFEADEEIEIGALWHRLNRTRIFSQKLTKPANRLRKLRNKLAHLQICGPEDIPPDREWLT